MTQNRMIGEEVMYQIYVDREKTEIKISKIKNIFRGTKQEHEALQNPTKVIYYNTLYSFCATRSVLVEYANSIKEQWLSDAREMVKKIEDIKI